MIDRLLDVVFPARCLGCGRRGVALCGRCVADLPLLPEWVCRRCASAYRAGHRCVGCERLSLDVSSVRAVCTYDGIARKAVHQLKFRSGRFLVPVLGELMRNAIAHRPIRADVVIPVPLAPGRLRERGYNQAALLADQIAALVGGDLRTDVLERDDRRPQQTLDASARARNLAGAVRATRTSAVEQRRVLLVDDVLTTGATVSAAAEALAEAGAARVSAFVFARAI